MFKVSYSWQLLWTETCSRNVCPRSTTFKTCPVFPGKVSKLQGIDGVGVGGDVQDVLAPNFAPWHIKYFKTKGPSKMECAGRIFWSFPGEGHKIFI